MKQREVKWPPQGPITNQRWSRDWNSGPWVYRTPVACSLGLCILLSQYSPHVGCKNELLNNNNLRRKWVFKWTGNQKKEKERKRKIHHFQGRTTLTWQFSNFFAPIILLWTQWYNRDKWSWSSWSIKTTPALTSPCLLPLAPGSLKD